MEICAEKYIYTIKNKIKYENRFFIDEEFNKILNILCDDKHLISNIEKDTILLSVNL